MVLSDEKKIELSGKIGIKLNELSKNTSVPEMICICKEIENLIGELDPSLGDCNYNIIGTSDENIELQARVGNIHDKLNSLEKI